MKYPVIILGTMLLLALILLPSYLFFRSLRPKDDQTTPFPKVPQITKTPLPTLESQEKYPLHQNIVATVFWIGEEASQDNGFISNHQSAWDTNWVKSFGGIDDPKERDGFFPKGFVPKENPFYLALPYSDFDKRGRKGNIQRIPWYEAPLGNVSLIKNRWVKIIYQNRVCFAQWENAGPSESDDIGYVFGSTAPKNTFGQKAGIDISPAVRDCLNAPDVAKVSWQFVDDRDVPPGPWKQIITRSNPRWE